MGIVLSHKVETAPSDWIRLLVKHQRSSGVRKDMYVGMNLFVIPSYAPTDCSTDTQKDEFHCTFVTLVRKNKGFGIEVVAGNFIA